MSTLERNVRPFLAIAALALLPAVSMADGGGEPAAKSHAKTCAEATRDAFFNRQMQLSDGDVTPAVAVPAECSRKVARSADDDENQLHREWGIVDAGTE
jgi:hypothetical protein